jgi:ribonuclease BN (tRNA processing enzyme)
MKAHVRRYTGIYEYVAWKIMTIRSFINIASLIALTAVLSAACTRNDVPCRPGEGVTLQILGSGGPIADDARASSGYLLWIEGESRVLIDAGGGTFLRFGEAGANFEELDFIGLSHLHTDHSADLPALLKSGSFSDRVRPLPVAGPDGDDAFPGLNDYLRATLSADGGAYGYLSGFLDGTANTPLLTPREVERGGPSVVYTSEDLRIDALHVPHGIVPAVAFRVTTGDQVFVFATDQNGDDPAFIEFANGASILVMHMVVPDGASGVARRLHAPPGVIGEIAANLAPGKLVLSHLMARSLRDLEQNVALVQARYKGDIIVAEDLACVSP